MWRIDAPVSSSLISIRAAEIWHRASPPPGNHTVQCTESQWAPMMSLLFLFTLLSSICLLRFCPLIYSTTLGFWKFNKFTQRPFFSRVMVCRIFSKSAKVVKLRRHIRTFHTSETTHLSWQDFYFSATLDFFSFLLKQKIIFQTLSCFICPLAALCDRVPSLEITCQTPPAQLLLFPVSLFPPARAWTRLNWDWICDVWTRARKPASLSEP